MNGYGSIGNIVETFKECFIMQLWHNVDYDRNLKPILITWFTKQDVHLPIIVVPVQVAALIINIFVKKNLPYKAYSIKLIVKMSTFTCEIFTDYILSK